MHVVRKQDSVQFLLGVHDMQQASHKAEPGDYKHAVNDNVGMKLSRSSKCRCYCTCTAAVEWPSWSTSACLSFGSVNPHK